MNICRNPTEERTTRFARDDDGGTKTVQSHHGSRPAAVSRSLPDEAHLISVGRAACGLVHDMRNLAFSMGAVLARMAAGCGRDCRKDDVQSMIACVKYLEALSTRVARLIEPSSVGDQSQQRTALRDWWLNVQPLMKLVAPAPVRLQSELDHSRLWIAVDANCLTHALLNLVHNAWKALQSSRDGRIEIWAVAKNQHVAVGVTDNGPGLPREIVQELNQSGTSEACKWSVNRCTRIAPARCEPQIQRAGHGLGIVRDIALSAGGQFRVRTSPSAGTTFMLELPGGEI